MSDRRVERLSDLLREEIAKIIDRELELPDNTMLTVTRVAVSPDKHYAAVMISVLGGEHQKTLEILEKHVYNIQQLLNRRVRMRPVPKIRFVIDENEERREIVEKSLSKLKQKGEI